jgi:hypothetical protein
VLGKSWKEPAFVFGRKKDLPNYSAWKVLKALKQAGPDGLKKDALEGVAGHARRILKALRSDSDWARVIDMALKRGNRYRLRTE